MIEEFLKKESSGGILLIIATFLALILSNTFMSSFYDYFLQIPVEIKIGPLELHKTLHHWVNDGLMAIFFFLIGLEVKREILEGHLSSFSKVSLPGFAALGGMCVPALFYYLLNQDNPLALSGWAIPTATDIAFALAILSLLGSRIPVSLKIFLMALAIIDDLGAIIIIAIFYSTDLSIVSITVAVISLIGLILLNTFNVTKKSAYFILGTILWISVLKSGVHATLAGVALAFTIPIKGTDEFGKEHSPLKEIEHGLHYWVAFYILPLFAFVNAGIDITKISFTEMSNSVPMGILAGLFLGKQIGVFGFSWLAIKLKLATLPEECNWTQLYGVSVLTGIGFTMSLFISSLAFVDDTLFQYTDKLAILIASFASGLLGYIILKTSKKHE